MKPALFFFAFYQKLIYLKVENYWCLNSFLVVCNVGLRYATTGCEDDEFCQTPYGELQGKCVLIQEYANEIAEKVNILNGEIDTRAGN